MSSRSCPPLVIGLLALFVLSAAGLAFVGFFDAGVGFFGCWAGFFGGGRLWVYSKTKILNTQVLVLLWPHPFWLDFWCTDHGHCREGRLLLFTQAAGPQLVLDEHTDDDDEDEDADGAQGDEGDHEGAVDGHAHGRRGQLGGHCNQ